MWEQLVKVKQGHINTLLIVIRDDMGAVVSDVL